jgi:hypothetical protein
MAWFGARWEQLGRIVAKPTKADTDKLTQYRKLFDTARSDMETARKDSELSRDFYDGDQWTQTEEATILSRGQVPIKINRVQRAIDGIMGVIESSKTDPRALMRNPPDEQNPQPGVGPSPPTTPGQPGPMPPAAAPQMAPQGPQPMGGPTGAAAQPPKKPLDAGDVATMTLRFIADTTQFKTTTKMDVLENGLIEGCGAAIVEVDGNKDVSVTQIRWEEFFFDPKARRHDFQDARYLGVGKWMYADDVAALYPESKQEIGNFQSDGSSGLGLDQTWDDRPDSTTTPWIDSKLRRLMVVDMYHLEGGQWNRCVFYAGGILESAPSAYKDDSDRPCCPIEAWSCYINRKNERYGVVKMMRDPQREVNMRRSKAVHEINVRQIQLKDPSAPQGDVNEARKEASRPDGVIPPGYQVVPRQDMVANNIEMMNEAKSEVDRMGAAPSVLARQGADASGRAQQIRVQTGLQELSRVLNRHGGWETRIYKQMWWRARQFWNDPKWIRVTGDNEAPQYIRVNDPVPMSPTINPATGQPFFGGDQQPQIRNHIAKMDVDIELDKVPDTATLEQEVFAELVQLAQAYGPQAVPFPVLLEMSSLPKKREIIDKLEGYQAQQAPIHQAQMQAQMAKMEADLAEIKSNIRKNSTQADLNEANTVAAAMKAHLEVNRAAQLPPGITVNNSGTPVPVLPPPPGATGANGSRPSGPPPSRA